MLARAMFPRTVCDCDECVACCKHMPGFLAVGDPELLAVFLGVHVDELTSYLQASEGALVQKDGQQFRIPTIVPKLEENGCVFFTKENRCSCHRFAPFGCGWYDAHMSALEANKRSQQALYDIMVDFNSEGSYSQLRKHLSSLEFLAPSLLERRGNLEGALKLILEHSR